MFVGVLWLVFGVRVVHLCCEEYTGAGDFKAEVYRIRRLVEVARLKGLSIHDVTQRCISSPVERLSRLGICQGMHG
jgi:hypothetical protein